MEIINNNGKQPEKDPLKSKNIYIGTALIISGIIWMSYNLDIISGKIFNGFFSWQMFIIALGGYFLTLRKWSLGAITCSIGVLFALGDWFDLYLPVKDIILPAILIACGIAVLAQYLTKK